MAYLGDRAIPSSLSYTEVRPLLRWVYAWMCLGLFVTASVAVFTTSNASMLALATNPAALGIAIVAELALVIALSWGLSRMSPSTAAVLFMVYAGLNGFTLSLVLLYFSAGSIASAFFTTTALFGAMSIIGYTTEYDLTKLGGYLMMGLIGLVLAMIVNIFMGNGALDFVISIVGVVIFVGLTAYDTQKLKRMAASPELQDNPTMVARLSIYGALELYLDFVNLFLFLLRLFGNDD